MKTRNWRIHDRKEQVNQPSPIMKNIYFVPKDETSTHEEPEAR